MNYLCMYKFINLRTKLFREKTFSGQNDYFVLVDVVKALKPSVILTTEPIFKLENDKLVKIVRDYEVYGIPIPERLKHPIYGKFVNVNSSIPLKKYYTEDDVRIGSCAVSDVGKCHLDRNGAPVIYKQIQVFCKITIDNETFQPFFHKGWNPIQRAEWKYRWCYSPINKEDGHPSFYL